MKRLVTTTLFAALILAGGALAEAQVSIGIQIGPPPRPRVVRVQPRQPSAEYQWVDGYWYPVGRRYSWHEGFWTRPPLPDARWVPSRYDRQQYFSGYWQSQRGRYDDRRSDRDRQRDDRDADRRNPGRGRGGNR